MKKMQFKKGNLYHVYNQGNNKQKIFFNRENYLFFLQKIHTHILPYTDILAWCLMPNHFHLMVLVKETEIEIGGTTSKFSIGGATSSRTPNNKPFRGVTSSRTPNTRSLNKSIGILLASYTRAINKEQNLSGSLFRKRTKAECINCQNGISPSFIGNKINVAISEKQYPQVCFNYIHENPVKANLVKTASDWEFSSVKDYTGLRKGKLVNKLIAGNYVHPFIR